MPEVGCLGRFKEVLVGIPEIHGFPMRDGRTFKVKYMDGLTADFDLLRKKRVQALVVGCSQGTNMQQILVGLPRNFGRGQLEVVVARAMFGFSHQGISCGLGGCTLYAKNLITSRVQSLVEEFKKGGSEIMGETTSTTKRRLVSWNILWDKLIDHLVGEKDVPVGKYWELPAKLSGFLVNIGLYSNEHSARTFLGIAIRRGLVERVGSRNGRDTRWRVYNLPWPKGTNGKAGVIKDTPAPENSCPPVDLMFSALETFDNIMRFRAQLEKFFGDNPEMVRAFAERCGKQIERIEKAKKVAELYANFVAGTKDL